MKLVTSHFAFENCPGDAVVFFEFAAGEPTFASVYHGGRRKLRVPNAKGLYKPCATHAADLVREALAKKPKSNHAKSRVVESTPDRALQAQIDRQQAKLDKVAASALKVFSE